MGSDPVIVCAPTGTAAKNIKGKIGKQHQFIHADCLQWLSEEKGQYDLIFIDPPTFSNSKRMEGVLDVQRDHVKLIQDCMGLLNPDGVLCIWRYRHNTWTNLSTP